MNILFVIDTLGAGGKERQLIALLKGLKKRDWLRADVIVLSDRIEYEQIWSLAHRVHIIRRRLRKDPFVFFKLMELVRDSRPDVIHSWELMSSIYALPAAKCFGIPFVNGVVRNAPANFNFFSVSGLLFYLTSLFSDVTLGNSAAGLKAYNALSKKSVVISNGFDDSRLNCKIDPNTVRQEFQLGKGPVIGMTANFMPVKDHPAVIHAGVRLLQKDPSLTFVFIGDGPQLNAVKRLVPQEYLERFKFLGKQSTVESICQVFDIGLLTSCDSLSNALMEYMASGKPVIAYRCGGNPELVKDGVNGFLIEPQNSKELAGKIRYLLDNPQLAKKMGDEGRSLLKRSFGLDVMVSRTLQLYDRLITKKRS